MGKHMDHIYCFLFLSWKHFVFGQTLPLSFKDDSSIKSSHKVSHYGLRNTLMLFTKLNANNFYARDTTRPLKLLSGTEMPWQSNREKKKTERQKNWNMHVNISSTYFRDGLKIVQFGPPKYSHSSHACCSVLQSFHQRLLHILHQTG